MTTETITLSSFLLARLADDEAAARAATPGPWEVSTSGYAVRGNGRRNWVAETVASQEPCGDADHIAHHNPARVLAEVAAKRAIVEMFAADYDEHGLPSGAGGHGEAYCEALQHLAAVYSDHPSFREEWRP